MENPYRTTEAKAFVTFARLYFLIRSERWSSGVKLAARKVLTGSTMTYACPAWDYEVLNLRHLRNKDAIFACTCISSQNYTEPRE
jgi:hypothetical protein